MYATSARFDAIIKGNNRTFSAKLSVGGTDITSGFRSVKHEWRSVEKDTMGIGGCAAASLEVSMAAPAISLEGQEITFSIGMDVDGTVEYVPLGLFTVQKPVLENGVITFTAYDRVWSKLSGAYFSSLTYPTDGKAILAEIASLAGVTINTSNLPNGVTFPKRAVSSEKQEDGHGGEEEVVTYTAPFEGYMYREAIGYIAQFYGMFAFANRVGEIEFRWYSSPNYPIGADRYYDGMQTADSVFGISAISCTAGDQVLTAGTGDMVVRIENPVMTQERLNAILTQVSGLQFLPSEVSFLGDIRLDPGDIVDVTTKAGDLVRIPIMRITQAFDGGLKTEVQSFGGDAEQEGEQKGPTATKMDRLYTDLFLVKELVGDKASFRYARTSTIVTDRLILRGSTGSIVYALNNYGQLVSTEVNTLDGYILTDNTITADKIVVDTALVNRIFAQTITATGTITGGVFKGASSNSYIESANYSYTSGAYSNNGIRINLSGSGYIRAQNFALDQNGTLYAQNAVISGEITALSGEIGGFEIGTHTLTAVGEGQRPTEGGFEDVLSRVQMSTNIDQYDLSSKAFSISLSTDEGSTFDEHPFYVDYSGYLYAAAGELGGFKVEFPTNDPNVSELSNGLVYLGYDSIGAMEFENDRKTCQADLRSDYWSMTVYPQNTPADNYSLLNMYINTESGHSYGSIYLLGINRTTGDYDGQISIENNYIRIANGFNSTVMREAGILCAGSGNFGLRDYSFNEWVIYSDSYGYVRIPHRLYATEIYENGTALSSLYGSATDVSNLKTSMGVFSSVVEGLASGASKTFTFPNNTRLLCICDGSNANLRGMYIFYSSTAGAISNTPVLTASNVAFTTATNRLTVKNNGTTQLNVCFLCMSSNGNVS